LPADLPFLSSRVRAVIVREGLVLMDRTHHADRDMFYWLPGGGLEPGETSEEYLSENLFVESGDYRHELILYFQAEIVSGPHGTPSDPRMHEWHRPGEQPGPLLPPDVARELETDLAGGFTRPTLHLVTDERPPGAGPTG
jgi:8-oxo-dGTP pyrophosphatase MutT (NUDIX family)